MKKFAKAIVLTAVVSILSQSSVFASPASLENWFKVSAPAVGEAYVSSRYVTVISPEEQPVEFVNIRGGASVDNDVIGIAKVGQCLNVIDIEDGWYKVTYNDTTGYIYKDYVTGSIVEVQEAKEAEEAQAEAEAQAQAEAEEEARLQAEKEAEEEAQAEVTGIYASVNAYDGLNLRKEPSTDSEVVKTFDYGYCVDVLSVEGEWIKIDDNGTQGYIKSSYADLHNGEKPENETVQTVSDSKGQAVVEYAKKFLGTPYVYGGTSLTSGVDCSGFTYSVYKNFGINLNRVSRDQIKNGRSVAKSELQPGDLVFFNTGGNTAISHVGMYIGDGQYIHSTDGPAMGVTITSLSSSYSAKTYYGACRILS